MSEDINVTDGTVLECLNNKVDLDGRNYLGSGLEEIIKKNGGGSGLEIGDIGIAPFGIDESLNLRRYLNGQVISQEQFKSFTDKIKKAVELYPSLSATEENWQAEVTASVLGQCGKFVIDDELGTIRLPKVVNINGLQDLALIGGIKAESLPNHKHYEFRDKLQGYVKVTSNLTPVERVSFDSYGDYWVSGTGEEANTGLSSRAIGDAYQDNAPVQQEAIQYPYFIQVATGVEESLPAISEYKLNNPNFFGQSMWTDVTPNNASWLLSNGAFHSGATYGDYYNWLLKIYNKTETVEGVSVKGVSDEYTDYDFVVNTTNQTFRLPLLDGSESIISDRYVNLTLLASESTYTAPANGWFYLYGIKSTAGFTAFVNINSGATEENRTTLNNSGCGSIIPVRKNDVVRCNYDGVYQSYGFRFIYAEGNGSLYFYVGDTLKDAQVINAGAVLNDVALLKQNKVDRKGNETVVETYRNGNSWYRIYSDGWCEQGGYQSSSGATDGTYTVTLLKPYIDANYCLQITPYSKARTEGLQVRHSGYQSKTNTQFSLTMPSNTLFVNGSDWTARGYIR